MSALLLLDWANVSGGISMDGWQLDLALLPKAIAARIGQAVTEGVVVAPWRPGGGGITGVAHHLGYDCATRPMPAYMLERKKGTRCNMDAEFTLEAMKRASRHEAIVLGSADADFLPLAEALRAEGKTVYILGSARCAAPAVRDSGNFRFMNLAGMEADVKLRAGASNPKPFMVRAPRPTLGPARTPESSALIVDLPCLNSAAHREGWSLSMPRLIELVATETGYLPKVDIIVRDDVNLPAVADLAARKEWALNVIPPSGGGSSRKAQPDVIFTMAAVRAARASQHVALATGNGEFYRLTDELQTAGRNAIVAFPEASCSHRLSRLAAEKYLQLTNANVGREPEMRAPAKDDGPAI